MAGGRSDLDPATDFDPVRAEVPAYDELRQAVASATGGVPAARVADPGPRTGATGPTGRL